MPAATFRPGIAFRPPQPEELADCALIWHAAVNDYMTRLGRALPPPVLDPAVRLSQHLLATDPDLFRVAVRSRAGGRDKVVGFGIGLQREHVWYLSQLYVLPEEQGHGLGKALLSQILPAAPAAGAADEPGSGAAKHGILATCADTAQPIADALYAKLGIVPRVPVFNLVGRVASPAALPPLPDGVEAIPLEPPELVSHRNPAGPGRSELYQTIDLIDRRVLGYAHQADHDFLRVQGRTGFLYRTSSGEVLGYGYSSQVGRFGPLALLDDTLTAPVIGHLLREIEPRGAASAWVPGSNDRAMVAFLRAGLRMEGFPAMFCWTRPFAAFERYLPAGLALL
jgi:GNAT superfamily N-acetyltransferase